MEMVAEGDETGGVEGEEAGGVEGEEDEEEAGEEDAAVAALLSGQIDESELELALAPGTVTGYKGVSRTHGESVGKKFQAKAPRQRCSLGYFASARDAAIAYAKYCLRASRHGEESALAAAKLERRRYVQARSARHVDRLVSHAKRTKARNVKGRALGGMPAPADEARRESLGMAPQWEEQLPPSEQAAEPPTEEGSEEERDDAAVGQACGVLLQSTDGRPGGDAEGQERPVLLRTAAAVLARAMSAARRKRRKLKHTRHPVTQDVAWDESCRGSRREELCGHDA